MARRTFLHVGTPKSGTTYLQYVLWKRARPVMRHHGVLLPGQRATHFAAAKGVTGKRDQQRRTDTDPAQAWRSLASQVNAWDGDALVCHELFAPATARRAARAKSALHGSQVHVVLTARSLARQIPAAWQQQVRAGLATTYDEFLERLHHGDPVRDRFRRRAGKAGWFWRVQDLADIAERWAADIPPEHVHIVTLPPDASKPGLLWERYSSVLGLDGADVDSDVPKRNVSLGRAETELLRRVNAARDPRFRGVSRHRWTRGLLASQILSQRAGEPIGLPEDARHWVTERTDAMLRQLEAAGYAVAGDLDDLTAAAPPAGTGGGIATDAEVEQACDWAIGRLAEHLDELRDSRGG
ncbi:MAG: hypothetical protein M3165_03855, partial [Actinomycetota bacterium]|nr:hypothetical protein [Actinomycetota bacterium]